MRCLLVEPQHLCEAKRSQKGKGACVLFLCQWLGPLEDRGTEKQGEGAGPRPFQPPQPGTGERGHIGEVCLHDWRHENGEETIYYIGSVHAPNQKQHASPRATAGALDAAAGLRCMCSSCASSTATGEFELEMNLRREVE